MTPSAVISPAPPVAPAGTPDGGPSLLETVGRRAAKGALALTARQVVGQGVSILAGVVLARLFAPSFLVIYALVEPGEFPKPVRLAAGSVACWEPDLDKWIESRIAGSTGSLGESK